MPTITSHNLTLAIHAVKNGVWVDENVTITNISNDTITFEQSGASGANIYAFPSNATITLGGTVISNGVTYSAETQTAQSVSNTDLSRSILSTPTWDSASTGDITFSVEFGGTVAENNKYIPMVCSGRFDDRSQSSQQFSCVGNGSALTFTATGELKNYPMSTEGDKISLPRMQFTCNGVTYVLESQEINLRNAITSSYWLRNVTFPKHYYRDGGSSVGDPLISLIMQIEGVVMDTDPVYESVWIAQIKTVSGQYLMPEYCQMERDPSDPTNIVLNISASFDGVEGYDDVDTNCMITADSMGNQFDYKGIRYYFPIWPVTVGSWEL